MDFHSMKRKQLQALCKKHNIPANLKNVEMADRLAALLKVDDEKPKEQLVKPCLRNLEDLIVIDEEISEGKEHKKVRFSPQDETFLFEKTNPRAVRATRRHSMAIGEDQKSKKGRISALEDVQEKGVENAADEQTGKLGAKKTRGVGKRKLSCMKQVEDLQADPLEKTKPRATRVATRRRNSMAVGEDRITKERTRSVLEDVKEKGGKNAADEKTRKVGVKQRRCVGKRNLSSIEHVEDLQTVPLENFIDLVDNSDVEDFVDSVSEAVDIQNTLCNGSSIAEDDQGKSQSLLQTKSPSPLLDKCNSKKDVEGSCEESYLIKEPKTVTPSPMVVECDPNRGEGSLTKSTGLESLSNEEDRDNLESEPLEKCIISDFSNLEDQMSIDGMADFNSQPNINTEFESSMQKSGDTTDNKCIDHAGYDQDAKGVTPTAIVNVDIECTAGTVGTENDNEEMTMIDVSDAEMADNHDAHNGDTIEYSSEPNMVDDVSDVQMNDNHEHAVLADHHLEKAGIEEADETNRSTMDDESPKRTVTERSNKKVVEEGSSLKLNSDEESYGIDTLFQLGYVKDAEEMIEVSNIELDKRISPHKAMSEPRSCTNGRKTELVNSVSKFNICIQNAPPTKSTSFENLGIFVPVPELGLQGTHHLQHETAVASSMMVEFEPHNGDVFSNKISAMEVQFAGTISTNEQAISAISYKLGDEEEKHGVDVQFQEDKGKNMGCDQDAEVVSPTTSIVEKLKKSEDIGNSNCAKSEYSAECEINHKHELGKKTNSPASNEGTYDFTHALGVQLIDSHEQNEGNTLDVSDVQPKCSSEINHEQVLEETNDNTVISIEPEGRDMVDDVSDDQMNENHEDATVANQNLEKAGYDQDAKGVTPSAIVNVDIECTAGTVGTENVCILSSKVPEGTINEEMTMIDVSDAEIGDNGDRFEYSAEPDVSIEHEGRDMVDDVSDVQMNDSNEDAVLADQHSEKAGIQEADETNLSTMADESPKRTFLLINGSSDDTVDCDRTHTQGVEVASNSKLNSDEESYGIDTLFQLGYETVVPRPMIVESRLHNEDVFMNKNSEMEDQFAGTNPDLYNSSVKSEYHAECEINQKRELENRTVQLIDNHEQKVGNASDEESFGLASLFQSEYAEDKSGLVDEKGQGGNSFEVSDVELYNNHEKEALAGENMEVYEEIDLINDELQGGNSFEVSDVELDNNNQNEPLAGKDMEVYEENGIASLFQPEYAEDENGLNDEELQGGENMEVDEEKDAGKTCRETYEVSERLGDVSHSELIMKSSVDEETISDKNGKHIESRATIRMIGSSPEHAEPEDNFIGLDAGETCEDSVRLGDVGHPIDSEGYQCNSQNNPAAVLQVAFERFIEQTEQQNGNEPEKSDGENFELIPDLKESVHPELSMTEINDQFKSGNVKDKNAGCNEGIDYKQEVEKKTNSPVSDEESYGLASRFQSEYAEDKSGNSVEFSDVELHDNLEKEALAGENMEVYEENSLINNEPQVSTLFEVSDVELDNNHENEALAGENMEVDEEKGETCEDIERLSDVSQPINSEEFWSNSQDKPAVVLQGSEEKITIQSSVDEEKISDENELMDAEGDLIGLAAFERITEQQNCNEDFAVTYKPEKSDGENFELKHDLKESAQTELSITEIDDQCKSGNVKGVCMEDETLPLNDEAANDKGTCKVMNQKKRSILIHGTPVRPINTADMKENSNVHLKRELNMGDATAFRPLAKRKALGELHRK